MSNRPGPRICLPATSDYAFWASLLVSWVAQDSDGLLAVDQPAVWLIGLAGLGMTAMSVFEGTRPTWRNGSMNLAPTFATILFVTMIALTSMWVFVGIAHTRTPTAQLLYALCAVLSGWSAWAIFVTLNKASAQH